jgi:uncharacterized protein YndB with AHSA1/START domain
MSTETEKSFDLPVSLRIRGSIEEVFAAWVDPAQAENWLCDRLDGQWQPGKSVYWIFGDHRQELRSLILPALCPVKLKRPRRVA